MEQTELYYRFGVALGIGFLVGLQREFAHQKPQREIFAGERTFALMGLVGCGAAMAADVLESPWAFVGIVMLLGIMIAIAYFVVAWRHEAIGLTSETAALVVVFAGALCYWGYLVLAVAITVATTVILALKLETDTLVRRISREDVYATLKFAVITAIILPILPNRPLGPPPLDVLNPHKIWLMVIFISGISFFGYLLMKVVGVRQGIGLTGLLGGLASSTAVTLSFARRSQEEELAKPFALAITVAWAVMFARVLVEVAALNAALLKELWPPMVAAGAVGLAYCAYLYFSQRPDQEGGVEVSNPFELGPAIKFGLIYGAILLVSKVAQVYLGDTGIYLSSAVSGAADVDAITLSMAELSQASNGSVSQDTAARAIMLATMSNTVVKGGIVLWSGSPSLRRVILPGLLLILVIGTGTAFLL